MVGLLLLLDRRFRCLSPYIPFFLSQYLSLHLNLPSSFAVFLPSLLSPSSLFLFPSFPPLLIILYAQNQGSDSNSINQNRRRQWGDSEDDKNINDNDKLITNVQCSNDD